MQYKRRLFWFPNFISSNQKVIGIHYGTRINRLFNEGTIIIFPIINFYQHIQNNFIKVKEDKTKNQDVFNNYNNNKYNQSIYNDYGNNNISINQINNNIKM